MILKWWVIIRCCKLENEILKEAKNVEKWPKMIILRPKNVNFPRFWPFSKFHFSACSTLIMSEYKSRYSIWFCRTVHASSPDCLKFWRIWCFETRCRMLSITSKVNCIHFTDSHGTNISFQRYRRLSYYRYLSTSGRGRCWYFVFHSWRRFHFRFGGYLSGIYPGASGKYSCHYSISAGDFWIHEVIQSRNWKSIWRKLWSYGSATRVKVCSSKRSQHGRRSK